MSGNSPWNPSPAGGGPGLAPGASTLTKTTTTPGGAQATAVPPPLTTLPGDINLRDRVLELISGGSAGEKIVRGFLIGVALGLIIGGLCCCWMPCFGRAERARRRQQRAERMALLRGEAPLPLPPAAPRGTTLRAPMTWLMRQRGGPGS